MLCWVFRMFRRGPTLGGLFGTNIWLSVTFTSGQISAQLHEEFKTRDNNYCQRSNWSCESFLIFNPWWLSSKVRNISRIKSFGVHRVQFGPILPFYRWTAFQHHQFKWRIHGRFFSISSELPTLPWIKSCPCVCYLYRQNGSQWDFSDAVCQLWHQRLQPSPETSGGRTVTPGGERKCNHAGSLWKWQIHIWAPECVWRTQTAFTSVT